MGQLVRLGDIAEVSWRDEDFRYLGRYNGHKAVFLIASMKTGQNIHEIRNRIYRVYDSFEKNLPSGISLERGFDQSQNVKNKLGRLQKDFLFAISSGSYYPPATGFAGFRDSYDIDTIIDNDWSHRSLSGRLQYKSAEHCWSCYFTRIACR